MNMRTSTNFWVACSSSIAILTFLIAPSSAQGLIPTPRDEYEDLERYDPSRTMVVESKEVNGQFLYEYSVVEGPLPPMPPAMELTKYCPTPKSQVFGDCTTWATGFCSLSCQYALSRGRPNPQSGADIFAPQYIYPQINNGVNDGSYIFNGSNPSAVKLLFDKGCASEATAPYQGSVSNGWALQPSSRANGEAYNFRIATHQRCENLDDIRYAIIGGIPVVIAVWCPASMFSHAGTGFYEWDGDKYYNGKYSAHALCIVGYDNNKQAFLIQNSWGTGWGDQGRFWVKYNHFNSIAPTSTADGWCYEAHAIVAERSRQTMARATDVPPRTYFLMPDGSILLSGTLAQIKPSGSFSSIEATSRFIYGLSPAGKILGFANNNWYDISSPASPSGLGGGATAMVAATPEYLYAITKLGNVRGRVPKHLANGGNSHWEKINLPAGETPIDIRFRDNAIYVATADGDIYKRLPGVGWNLEN
jgi:hypothetical protein